VKLDVRQSKTLLTAQTTCPLFAEAPAWKAVGPGWRPLFGNHRDLGFSFEWHDFTARETFDWSRSFHPGSVELCLNHQLVESLRHCPVFAPAREMWFRSKALEVAAHLFFRPSGGELLCTRAQRLARERVEKARVILRERMHAPPSLKDPGLYPLRTLAQQSV